MKKLIRDNIPQFLEARKAKYTIRILEIEEYNQALEQKLVEEVKEFIKASNQENKKEELADILEIIDALYESNNFSQEEIQEIKYKKQITNGAFEKRLFLEELVKEDEK